MRYFLTLLLMVISCRAASPSFSSFNTNQFSTNNLFISIKDGASVTNITNTRSGGSSPSSVATLGDLLWRDVAGEATLTNTMESMVFFHDLNAGDDDSIALDYFVTTDQNFTNYAGLYAPFSSTSSSIQSYTIFGNGGPTEENRVQLSTDATSASIQMLFNGVLTDGFNVATPSGYTGAGTLFLSDDGTYKAAGGVGGDSIWTNITGYVTMIPGQTATNTLNFTSGAADNATNILLKVDSANALSASGSLLASFGNGGTNVMELDAQYSGLLLGRSARSDWGQGAGVIAFYDTSVGESADAAMVVGVTDGGSGYDYAYLGVNLTQPENSLFQMTVGGSPLVAFKPGVLSSGTAVAYTFDTANLLEPGDSLVQINNSSTNQMVIGPTGEIALGRGIASFFGSISDGEALVSLRDATEGEPDGNQIDLITLTADGQNRARLIASGNGTSFTLTHKGTSRTDLQPGVTSTGSSIAYEFDTSNTLTNGDKFVSVQNAGTEVLNISPNSTGAQIVFGPGDTNVLKRVGSNLTYTNGLTTQFGFDINDGAGHSARFQNNGDGSPRITSSRANYPIYLNAGGVTAGLQIAAASIVPQVDNTMDIGNASSAGAWKDLFLKGKIYIQSTNDYAGNMSRLSIDYRTSTNFIAFNSESTGTGVSKPMVFRLSGSDRQISLNPAVTLTESSATTVANITVASSQSVGGVIRYTINADDATDFQSRNGVAVWSAVNKAGTVTASITAGTEDVAVSAGTLTVTWTAVANGNSVDLKANAVSSLSQSTLACRWEMDLRGTGTSTVTPQ